MNKKLKFSSNLVPLILNGEKTVTWRLWDDKDLKDGNIIDMFDIKTGKQFARAKILKVSEKPMGNLTNEDRDGHEKYNSDEEMYQTYIKYYQQEVNPKTLVKVILFELC